MQLQSELLLEFLYSREWLRELRAPRQPRQDDRGREIETMARGMVAAGSTDHPSFQMGSDVLALRAVNRGMRWFYLTPDQQHVEQCKTWRIPECPDFWLDSMQHFRGSLHVRFLGNCVGSCRVLGAYLETLTREAARREALKLRAIKIRAEESPLLSAYQIARSL